MMEGDDPFTSYKYTMSLDERRFSQLLFSNKSFLYDADDAEHIDDTSTRVHTPRQRRKQKEQTL